MPVYLFRCKSNPTAAPLRLETAWESREMQGHPDYERIDEFGELVVNDLEEKAGEQILMR